MKQRQYCAVSGCPNASGKTVLQSASFHKFPAEDERKKMWMKALGVLSGKRRRVCSLHFTEDAFEGRLEAQIQAGYKFRRLRHDAVPMYRTIEHAPEDVHCLLQVQDDVTVEPLVQTVTQRRRCCAVPGCPNGSGNSVSQSISFYDFPAQNELKQTWLKALGVPSDTCRGVVCSSHFNEDSSEVEPLVQTVTQRRRCCAVPGCPNGSGNSVSQSISFYDFPAQNELKQTWLKALGVPSDTCRGVVCSSHFNEDSSEVRLEAVVHAGHETRQLRCDAVPMPCATECAPEDVCGTWHVQDDQVAVKQLQRCAVPGCPNASGKTVRQSASFHKFPAEDERKKMWMKALGVLNVKRRRVCSLHFSEDAFEGRLEAQIQAGYKFRRLRRDAIPIPRTTERDLGDVCGTQYVQDGKTQLTINGFHCLSHDYSGMHHEATQTNEVAKERKESKVAVPSPDGEQTTGFTVGICKEEPHCVEESSCDNAPSRENSRLLYCHLCPHTVKTQHCLKDHLLVHSGEKKYECSICAQRFAYLRNLRRHMPSHSTEKRYRCRRCPYDTTDKNAYNRHIVHHEATKRYACSMCSYVTSRCSDMVKHLRNHTGDRPFKCVKCSYAAANKSTLTRHVRTQHKDYD
ncbi:hypothetical protein MTO96_031014 [Rhipicephalus appendiculatus]